MPIMKIHEDDDSIVITWLEDSAGVEAMREYGLRIARRVLTGTRNEDWFHAWQMNAARRPLADEARAARYEAMPFDAMFTEDGARPWTREDSQALADQRMQIIMSAKRTNDDR